MQATKDNVILKVTIKEKIGGIILSNKEKDKAYYIDKIEVHSIGDEVKSVKKGQEVLIKESLLGLQNAIKNYKKKPKEGTSFLGVKEDDIIGIYK